ncbi:calcium-binding protein [Devosia pacifica]|uniref:Calcium-binding protein n=1 Tax=Devosia pacifica TaxID=1335967 RepID=A0A918S605_9HYPH|nr:Tim44/TimA family putative adaptor protein [Devosia pacifica]GHA23343.1 calcium-binding protein [Devosia pacifica]
MDEFLDLPTLIVIGVAVVILFRLRSVLGTRTGNERPPAERHRQRDAANDKATADDTVVPLRRAGTGAPDLDDERRQRKLEAEIEQQAKDNEKLAADLRAVAETDPSFMPRSFLEGAKGAYEMIVTAFAEGDKATLKSLLEKDVFEDFQRAMAEREAAGQRVDFTFVGLPKIAIVDAEADRRQVAVTVLFNAEVVSATYDKDNNLIEGHAEHVQAIADEWTFARNPKSRDPNWKVIGTSQVD